MYSRLTKVLLTSFLLFFVGLFYAKKINLATADIGRHIKNGEHSFQTFKPISTNFYSYTEPDFEVVNHHWGSGILFFLVWRAFDFVGLSIFYTLVNVLAFLCFFLFACKKSSFRVAFFVSVLTIPLLVSRIEIRPEGFSYLFLGVLLLLLDAFKEQKIRLVFVLPLVFAIQAIWVNFHIFFIFGLFLLGVFFLEAFLFDKEHIRKWGVLLAVGVVGSLINPYGIRGLLEPLTILKEYGYMIIENQSVLFMQKRFPKFLYFHFEVFLMSTFALVAYVFWKRKFREFFMILVCTVVFGLLGARAIRGFPLFGYFFMCFVSGVLWKTKGYEFIKAFRWGFASSLILILAGLFVEGHYYASLDARSGLGLLPSMQDSVKFFEENALKGPVFNNYDIGGYLIFNLFPTQKVFVDNRPEAYSVDFFAKTYIPMQESDEIWSRVDEAYGFNTIYFYRHDATPWAQPFLINRIKDPLWVPVFVDDYVLILVKDNAANQDVVSKYALPLETFSIQ